MAGALRRLPLAPVQAAALAGSGRCGLAARLEGPGPLRVQRSCLFGVRGLLRRATLLAGLALLLLLLEGGHAREGGSTFGTLSSGSWRTQSRSGRSATTVRSAVESCKSEAFLDEAIAGTATGSPNVLVVSFSTTWCGPCKLMDPKVAELSKVFAEKASFIKVMGDKDENDGIRIMRREGVRTVPLYQIYKDGQKVDSFSGADPDALTRNIEKHTGMSAPAAA
mmetsp:Transcript_46634/g.101732  ORF Transcript_46634/g.101732 Transcript_46634/m.101732 type:complete len:223 (+) Transcript_46634:98-766(+)